MHKYITLRGSGELLRRVIHDLEKIYLNFKNKETGKQIGLVQLMPREIKTYEVVFPATEKKGIKKMIQGVIDRHNGPNGGVAIHFGPFLKDKFIDGVEQL